MAEATTRRRATAQAADKPSTGWAGLKERIGASGVPGILVLALGGAAAAAMLLAEILPLYEVHVASASCEELAEPELADLCLTRGFEQHEFGLVLLAILTAVMAAGATLGRSRPAGVALCAIGLVVLVLSLGFDLPASRSTGEVGRNFTEARAVAGPGLWIEVLGGLLALGAGAVTLALKPPQRP